MKRESALVLDQLLTGPHPGLSLSWRQLAALGVCASTDLVDLDRVAIATVSVPVVDVARTGAMEFAAVPLDGDVVQSSAFGQFVAVVQPIEHQLNQYALSEGVDLAESLAAGVGHVLRHGQGLWRAISCSTHAVSMAFGFW